MTGEITALLDVVVVSHNSAAHLDACLTSIAAQVDGAGAGVVGDVVVVDNASSDRSAAVVAGYPLVRWVATGSNLGFGGGANRGVAAAAAHPYVAILNPDVIVDPHCLAQLVNELERRPHLGAVGPNVLNLDGSVYPSARTFPSLIDAAGHALLGSIVPGNRFTKRYVGIGQPDWISGTAMVVRRAAFEQVGGFDEAYFMYVEDVDLCWRWRQAGWRVDRVQSAALHHAIGGSSEAAPFVMIVAHHRSLWRFARRSTAGAKRLLLPVIGMGLVVRMGLVTARRVVLHRPPATQHR